MAQEPEQPEPTNQTPEGARTFSRRAFFIRAAAVGVGIPAAGGLLAAAGGASPSAAFGELVRAAGRGGGNPIQRENQLKGSKGWQSSEIADAIARKNQPESAPGAPGGRAGLMAVGAATTWTQYPISGYADQASINKGASINFYVSTSLPSYSIEIYRMGWYGGTGGRLIQTVANQTGVNQPVPTPDASTGLNDANWNRSYTLQTAASWVSGIYLAKLIASDGSVGYITFIVRDDSASADIVYQVAVTTWQAYNNWGGKSLYDHNSSGGRAYKVSYNRPYAYGGNGTGAFFDGDYNMVRFLESNGYNVTYVTSIDAHTNAGLMQGRKVFLSAWHDEYWSAEMRAAITSMRDSGKSLAFFDANNVYWQVRFEASAAGAPNRTQVCYKDAGLDPIAGSNSGRTTVRWRDQPVNQPENALLGVMYESDWGGNWNVSFPWVAQNTSHWVYSGTGMKDGDQIPGVIGYEYDKVWNNGLTPSGLTVLGNSPVTMDGTPNGTPSVSNGAIYQAGSGAWVFSTGTIFWAWKLDDNEYHSQGADPRLQRMTVNILDTMIGLSLPATPVPTPTPGSFIIYDDHLASGWYSTSWDATYDLSNTSPVHAGSASISYTATAGWAGLELNCGQGMSTSGYTTLQFSIRATQANQNFAVYLTGTDGTVHTKRALKNYGGTPSSTSWTTYKIPLADLQGNNLSLGSVTFHEFSGSAQPAIYIDDISLIGGSTTPTPTPTTTPTPSPTPTSTPITGQGLTLYDDALADGWYSYSWSATVNLANSNPVYAGSRSISYQATAGWAGLVLETGTAVATAGYTHLQFAARGSQDNQAFAIYLSTATQNLPKVPLANYGGNIMSGSWKIYTIPLADLGAASVALTDVVFHEWSGNSQPAIYIDQVQLMTAGSGGTPTPTPLPTATATATATATPSPTPSPTPGPTATPSPTPTGTPTGTPYVVYDDALNANWYDVSWDATVNFAVSNPVYAGTKAISYQATAGWAGLDLQTGSPASTAGYTQLRFAIYATQANQSFAVFLRDASGKQLASPLPLANAGGLPTANTWKLYSIPLSNLGAAGVLLRDVVIHEWSGAAQPVIYVDEIKLV